MFNNTYQILANLEGKVAGIVIPHQAAGIISALALGVFIIGTVGFASPEFMHSAAHDLRHCLSFPCH